MIKAVFFDMNETLLNLNKLRHQFNQHFTDGYVLKYWFTKLLHSSCIMGIMNEYRNFGELAAVELENLFLEHNKPLSSQTKAAILGTFKQLNAYEDVPPALALLKEKGIRTIAVSNSSKAMMDEQLTHAGIIDLFDAYYSVDEVQQYKPFAAIYLAVAKKEKLATKNIVMVATHDWDLFGSKKAGLTTAYIKRKASLYHPYYVQADYQSSSLLSLVKQITTSKEGQ